VVRSHRDSVSLIVGQTLASGVKFFILDVFAESKLSGNQLAVFLDPRKLSTPQMQRIAQETHYSETTFVNSRVEKDGGYNVRIFTPQIELPFAGHPTLGTAYVIQSRVIMKPVPEVRLNMKVGQIPVQFTYSGKKPKVLWMRQRPPKFGKRYRSSPVANFLNLDESDLDTRFPVQDVSTGVPFLIVPLKGLDEIRRAKLDRDKYLEFAKKTESNIVLVFSPETYRSENDLNVRVLIPDSGMTEDAATGSGNGCLAAYLVNYKYMQREKIDLRVEQGYEMGRRSLLLLRAGPGPSGIEVNVGGTVQFIAEGEFVRP
jgi:trans-2,3-dihydro-3-hydroxyanthranilate isomerase